MRLGVICCERANRHFDDSFCSRSDGFSPEVERYCQAYQQKRAVRLRNGSDVLPGNPDFAAGASVDDLNFGTGAYAEEPFIRIRMGDRRVKGKPAAADIVKRRGHERR